MGARWQIVSLSSEDVEHFSLLREALFDCRRLHFQQDFTRFTALAVKAMPASRPIGHGGYLPKTGWARYRRSIVHHE